MRRNRPLPNAAVGFLKRFRVLRQEHVEQVVPMLL